MNERVFSSEFTRGLDHLSIGEGYKIPDAPPAMPCFKCHTPPRTGAGSRARPYDHYWFVDAAALGRPTLGRLFFALELKQSLTLEWRYSRLQEHQRATLLRVERTCGTGGLGVVVVNFRRALSEAEKKRLRETRVRFNEVHAVRIRALIEGRKASGQDIPIEWFREHGIRLPRLEGVTDADGGSVIAWDPRPLLGVTSQSYAPTPEMFAWLDSYEAKQAQKQTQKREAKREERRTKVE